MFRGQGEVVDHIQSVLVRGPKEGDGGEPPPEEGGVDPRPVLGRSPPHLPTPDHRHQPGPEPRRPVQKVTPLYTHLGHSPPLQRGEVTEELCQEAVVHQEVLEGLRLREEDFPHRLRSRVHFPAEPGRLVRRHGSRVRVAPTEHVRDPLHDRRFPSGRLSDPIPRVVFAPKPQPVDSLAQLGAGSLHNPLR